MKGKLSGRDLSNAQYSRGIRAISWNGQVSMADGTTRHCHLEKIYCEEVGREVEMWVSRNVKKAGNPIVFSVWA